MHRERIGAWQPISGFKRAAKWNAAHGLQKILEMDLGIFQQIPQIFWLGIWLEVELFQRLKGVNRRAKLTHLGGL